MRRGRAKGHTSGITFIDLGDAHQAGSRQRRQEIAMQDLDANDITDAVIAQMADTPDPRLREIMEAAVRQLHAFAREVKLTPEEWLKGIAFATAVGQACTPYRQEFILLSDILGLSRLVNAMHDATGREEVGTETSLLGPFFREQAPKIALGGTIAHVKSGPEIVLYGQVTDPAGKPVPDAQMDVWQTGADGLYDLQAHDPGVMDMRGQLRCDAEGRFHFRTVKPIGYPIPMDGPVGDLVTHQNRHGFRPAHIHVLISAPGYRELVTALYFGDDEHVDSDTVFGVSASLVVHDRLDLPDAPIPGLPSIRYDFTLSQESGSGGGRVGSDPSRLAPAG
jgi:protocatechuate 3,4-dioxygenase beta subunit